jgi:hypothetical protein
MKIEISGCQPTIAKIFLHILDLTISDIPIVSGKFWCSGALWFPSAAAIFELEKCFSILY